MKSLFIFLIINSISLISKEKNPSVVCVHGFLGGAWTMHYLGKNIKKEGFDVLNWDYPSTKLSIKSHSENLVKKLKIISEDKPSEPIHFVTHSMGGACFIGRFESP